MAQLPRVNVYNDTETAERMVNMLEPLRDSWNELAGMTGLVSMSTAELRAAV
jgi:hypothetical protein